MHPSSRRDDWGGTAKTFHWLIAFLVFAQIVLGWEAVHWPLTPTKIDLFVWHKSLGMLILVLVVLRLLWRLGHPRPPYPEGMKHWEQRLAGTVHALLYVLLIAMPLSGWMLNSAANVPVKLFWILPLPHLIAPDRALVYPLALSHVVMGWTLAVLIVVHIAAALHHHFVRRDRLLRRMLPRALGGLRGEA
jgi:cytochrome b561